MASSLRIHLDDPNLGIDTEAEVPFLIKSERALTRIARSLRVKPLSDFYSEDPAKLAAMFAEQGETPPAKGFPDEEWFEASEGLHTVRVLLRFLNENREAVPDVDEVKRDLRRFEKILAEAAKLGAQWHLGGEA